MADGNFILGDDVPAFEREFAAYCGTAFSVGVADGTAALLLSFKALDIGPGDEVITAPNSWISTAATVVHVGARPVFVDVRDDQNIDPALIEAAITPRTRAIVPVHLSGRCADMPPILDIARRRGLHVIEDAAQAVGAEHGGRRAGAHGVTGCFSMHPVKNLNAPGDAGMIATSDAALAGRLRLLRNHGLATRDDVVEWGYNSRLDTLHAAVMRIRLRQVESVIAARRRHAALYNSMLGSVVQCPLERPGERHSYMLFVIQCDRRDALRAFLAARGIDAKIHYPTPIHLQPAARGLGYRAGDFPNVERQAGRILSLPIHQWLTDAQVEKVAATIIDFYGG